MNFTFPKPFPNIIMAAPFGFIVFGISILFIQAAAGMEDQLQQQPSESPAVTSEAAQGSTQDQSDQASSTETHNTEPQVDNMQNTTERQPLPDPVTEHQMDLTTTDLIIDAASVNSSRDNQETGDNNVPNIQDNDVATPDSPRSSAPSSVNASEQQEETTTPRSPEEQAEDIIPTVEDPLRSSDGNGIPSADSNTTSPQEAERPDDSVAGTPAEESSKLEPDSANIGPVSPLPDPPNPPNNPPSPVQRRRYLTASESVSMCLMVLLLGVVSANRWWKSRRTARQKKSHSNASLPEASTSAGKRSRKDSKAATSPHPPTQEAGVPEYDGPVLDYLDDEALESLAGATQDSLGETQDSLSGEGQESLGAEAHSDTTGPSWEDRSPGSSYN